MRNLLTLLALCFSVNVHAEWRNELFALAGPGKNYKTESPGYACSFGIKSYPAMKHLYFSFGICIDYISGKETSNTFFGPSIVSRSENYITEVGTGLGFRYKMKRITLKAGADICGMFSLSGHNSTGGILPQVSVTYKVGDKDLGLLFKKNIPFLTDGSTYPSFFVGGLVLRM